MRGRGRGQDVTKNRPEIIEWQSNDLQPFTY